MKKLRLLCFSVLLLASAASAHQDRLLTVLADGAIPEIPASLGPVFLKMSGLGGPTPAVTFRAGNKATTLPPCFTRLISATMRDVQVSGSWYHEESVLPYYVNVTFSEPDRLEGRPYNASLSVLFNLRTTQVIKVHQYTPDPSGNGVQYADVTASCGSDKRSSAAR